jgi:hypothetical protein
LNSEKKEEEELEGELRRKNEEQKVKINLKISAKFQNYMSTNGKKKIFEILWRNKRFGKVSYRAASMHLKI